MKFSNFGCRTIGHYNWATTSSTITESNFAQNCSIVFYCIFHLLVSLLKGNSIWFYEEFLSIQFQLRIVFLMFVLFFFNLKATVGRGVCQTKLLVILSTLLDNSMYTITNRRKSMVAGPRAQSHIFEPTCDYLTVGS